MSHGEEVSLMPKGVLDLKTEVPAPIKKVQSSLQLPSKEAFEEVVATCWATLLATLSLLGQISCVTPSGASSWRDVLRCWCC